MRWIEVIEVRLSGINHQATEGTLNALKDDVVKQLTNNKIRLYRRYMLNSDICIHLTHEAKEIDPNGSPLALQMISVLSELGRVSHKVWIEVEKSN